MNKKFFIFFVSFGFAITSIVLQSVVFPLFFENDYMPDLPLIALVYFSINYGKILGESLGFFSGIVLDSLSGVPFGLNALVRLIMGFTLGFFEGKIFMDKLILPSIIITICTLIKFLLYNIISFFYPIDLNINFFSFRYLIELLMNIVLTPFIFIFFNFLKKKLFNER